MDNGTIWGRRSASSKLSLTTGGNPAAPSNDHSTRNFTLGRRVGDSSSHSNKNPFNAASQSLASPTSASSAFGLGTGAFASFGASKTPKTPGTALDFGGALGVSGKTPSAEKGLKDLESKLSKTSLSESKTAATSNSQSLAKTATADTWVFWCRPPMQKSNGQQVPYEDTLHSMLKFGTEEDFCLAFRHLKHPSVMPIVWEYHLFKDGIRPIWEDKENRNGGKWVIRVKKGVADRYWEILQMSLVDNCWGDLGEEICGGVVSMRSGEDILSLWLRDAASGRNLKIKQIWAQLLECPANTNFQFLSHDQALQNRVNQDESRKEKSAQHGQRSSLNRTNSKVDYADKKQAS